MSDTPQRPEAEERQPIETRKVWVVPHVQTLRAGDAEVGTQSTKDGAFTFS